MAVSSMGEKLPNLVELKLNGSFVPQLRDLGTSLQRLRVLWLSRSHLEELGGIASGLPRLQELYVSFNEIRDVSALAEMDELEVVDLESNQVSDLEAVDYLSMCPALRSLSLSGNPLAFDQQNGLRHAVATRIPLLEYLDDEPVTEADREGRSASQGTGDPASTGSRGEAGTGSSSGGALVDGLEAVSDDALSSEELALIADGIKYARVGIDDGEFEERAIESDVVAGLGSRPSTAAPSLRPGKRPGTGASYASASSTSRGSTPGSRPASALYRTRSGSGSERPSSTGSRGSSGGADGPGVEGGGGGGAPARQQRSRWLAALRRRCCSAARGTRSGTAMSRRRRRCRRTLRFATNTTVCSKSSDDGSWRRPTWSRPSRRRRGNWWTPSATPFRTRGSGWRVRRRGVMPPRRKLRAGQVAPWTQRERGPMFLSRPTQGTRGQWGRAAESPQGP